MRLKNYLNISNWGKKISIFFLLIIALLFIFLIQASPLFAAPSKFIEGLKATGEAGAGYPAAAGSNPASFISRMLGSALTPIFMGVSAMISLAYGGYKWMMSRGNEQDVELAKTIITNTLLATIVAFSALAIVKLIIPLWAFVTE